MTEPEERDRPVVGAGPDVAGDLIQAERNAREARQQLGRASDAVAALWAPVKQAERLTDAAMLRLHALNEAATSRVEWLEAQEQHRDAIRRQVADRAASRGRGPAARAAAERLSRSAYDVVAARDRAAELGERATAYAERTGDPDPMSWNALRDAAEQTVRTADERREVAMSRVDVELPSASARLAEARDRALLAELVAADAARRAAEAGLDVDRVREQALEGGGVAAPAPADPGTEAAIRSWEERGDDVER